MTSPGCLTVDDQAAADHRTRLAQLRSGDLSVLPATIAAILDPSNFRLWLDHDVAQMLAKQHPGVWNATLQGVCADYQERKKRGTGNLDLSRCLYSPFWLMDFVCAYLLPNGLPTEHLRIFNDYRELASQHSLPLEFRLSVMRLYKLSALPDSTLLGFLRLPKGLALVRAKLNAEVFQTLYRDRQVGHVIYCMLFFPEAHAFLTKSQRARLPCLEELPKLAKYKADTPPPIPVASLLQIYGWQVFKESAAYYLAQVTGLSHDELRAMECEALAVTWPKAGSKARVARGGYDFTQTGILVDGKQCFWRCGQSNILLVYHSGKNVHLAVEADLSAKGFKLLQWHELCTDQYGYTPTDDDLLTNLYRLLSTADPPDIEFDRWRDFLPHIHEQEQTVLFPLICALVAACGARVYAGELAGISCENYHTQLTTDYLIPRGFIPPPFMTATLG